MAALLICTSLLSGGVVSAASLYWGSQGEQVRQLQQKLQSYGYKISVVDGIYGSATYNAVVAFQKNNKLNADGVVGPATAAAVGISLSGTTTASRGGTTATSSDLYLLARLVYGEARGESYLGKVAVAAVVLNRVKSSLFPNTVSGVIYQNGAFSVVNDGQIYLSPDSEAIRAAQDALNGWDPTGGCLYYYNPKKTSDSWIRTRPVQIIIGQHYFAT
jgi:N-acetylmuramoyl-L-alanine amidase